MIYILYDLPMIFPQLCFKVFPLAKLREMLETLIWVGVDREKAKERKLQPVHIAAANGHSDTCSDVVGFSWAKMIM